MAEEEVVDDSVFSSKVVLSAIMHGKMATVKKEIDKDPSQLTLVSKKRGWAPLQVAAGYGHLEVVEGLLAEGCKADTKDKMGMTPMHAAADVDDSSVMAKLIETAEGKATINAVDEDGCTALHYAAFSGRADIVKVLLEAGADCTLQNTSEKTAALEAEEQGHSEVATAISEAAAAAAAAE